MEWHINDLSLCGQFHDTESLVSAIEPILKLRLSRPDLRNRILISKQLYLRNSSPSQTFIQALSSIQNRSIRELAVRWLANGGPFWEDERTQNSEDLFYFGTLDVTDQGLGEAARKLLDLRPARVFSFLNAGEDLARTTLRLAQGMLEEKIADVDVRNTVSVEDLAAELEVQLGSWTDLYVLIQARFQGLQVSAEIPAQLQSSPFHRGVAQRVADLMSILDELARSFREDGSLDASGKSILQKHFVGEKANFSDEAEKNKLVFRDEMTFKDPSAPEENIFCPWHGKVKIGQFRIHFEWPKPAAQRFIKVLYIGPKLTTW